LQEVDWTNTVHTGLWRGSYDVDEVIVPILRIAEFTGMVDHGALKERLA